MPGYSGGTTANDLLRLRRMVNEAGTATYTDSLLISLMSSYPLPDSAGAWPTLTSGSVNPVWVANYDYAATASDIWSEKAMPKADNFAFTADGATFNKQQQYEQYMKNARMWRSRRAPGNHDAVVWPAEPIQPLWIGNLAEQD